MSMKQNIAAGLWTAALFAGGIAWAASQYGPGASDTEIKIGNTTSKDGPASAYGAIATAEAAYFSMINDRGGINGRKINFISRDDGYNPSRTIAGVRRMVDEDHVLLFVGTLGTPTNEAIQGYLNDNKIPQLFVASGADKWNDPRLHPWTMGWQPSYRTEARLYATYILKNRPDAKIAVLYQNDDFGKDYLIGLRQGLGDQADKMIVATRSKEAADTNIESHVAALQASGANTLLTAAIPDAAAQVIRRVQDTGWQPMHFLANVSISVGSVLSAAGLKKSAGIISAGYLKDPAEWRETPEYAEWLAWMEKYNPSADLTDASNVYGYSVAQTLTAVLRASGDNLTRANVMKQAASIHNLRLPMLLPGIDVSTSPNDFAPIKKLRLVKFDGAAWRVLGNKVTASRD
jgi:branched-chain amino acid transport system substrate-binding protein